MGMQLKTGQGKTQAQNPRNQHTEQKGRSKWKHVAKWIGISVMLTIAPVILAVSYDYIAKDLSMEYVLSAYYKDYLLVGFAVSVNVFSCFSLRNLHNWGKGAAVISMALYICFFSNLWGKPQAPEIGRLWILMIGATILLVFNTYVGARIEYVSADDLQLEGEG